MIFFLAYRPYQDIYFGTFAVDFYHTEIFHGDMGFYPSFYQITFVLLPYFHSQELHDSIARENYVSVVVPHFSSSYRDIEVISVSSRDKGSTHTMGANEQTAFAK